MPEPISRRAMLRSSLLLAAGSALGVGCAPAALAPPAGPSLRGRRFAPVRVSADRVIRTTAGLRPYRPSGFVVRAESLGDTTVIHNYGHGGGGITLSWGSSELAAELAQQTGESRFAVLGSGILGLTAARRLQDRGYDVTIYTRDLPPFTTSNMSGGQWSPSSVADFQRVSPAFRHQFERASRFSHRYFQSLVGGQYGVRWIENYALGYAPPQPPREGGPPTLSSHIDDLYAESHVFGPGEHPFAAPYARRFTTMLIEPATFLYAAQEDFLLRGGKIEVRDFHDLDEVLSLPEPVVVNSTGLGAAALFGDRELVPVKGQLVVLLPQPEVDYIVIDGSSYMFPRADGIVLGGSNERGVTSLESDPAIVSRILEGNRETLEGMRG